MSQRAPHRPFRAEDWHSRNSQFKTYQPRHSSGSSASFNLTNRQVGLILAGSVLLALGVGSAIRLTTSDPAEVTTAGASGATSGTTAFQDGPFIPSSSGLRLADPSLLQSTPKEARLDAVVAGRPDPFAPVAQPVSVAPTQKAAEPLATVSTPPAPPQLPVIPVTATQALPPLPSVAPPLPNLGPVAALPVPSELSGGLAPSALPQNLVDRIEISGVAQIGDRVSVIVKEPGATTSRYVRAGDAIANGQVRIKRIELSGTEPAVVLEYNGQEFYRSVGSTALAGLL